jgi:hypothetical protein
MPGFHINRGACAITIRRALALAVAALTRLIVRLVFGYILMGGPGEIIGIKNRSRTEDGDCNRQNHKWFYSHY